MRVPIILIFSFILSSISFASDDKAMAELFMKYDQVMDHKKVDLIDDVFTEKFIKDSGGKKELIEKIKELPAPQKKNKKVPTLNTKWRKGLKRNIYFAKVKERTHESEFVIVKEDGKLKIDGALSDAD